MPVDCEHRRTGNRSLVRDEKVSRNRHVGFGVEDDRVPAVAPQSSEPRTLDRRAGHVAGMDPQVLPGGRGTGPAMSRISLGAFTPGTGRSGRSHASRTIHEYQGEKLRRHLDEAGAASRPSSSAGREGRPVADHLPAGALGDPVVREHARVVMRGRCCDPDHLVLVGPGELDRAEAQ